MRWPTPPFAPTAGSVRRWSLTVLVLRLVLLAAGAAALWLACGGRFFSGAGVVALVGVLGLLTAVPQPYGIGPTIVLAAAAIGWAVRHGTSAPPVGQTLLLAVALALHHQAAALAAVLPVTANVDRRLLVRFGWHAVLVLALSAAVAVLALGVSRPGGSVPLELAGLAAAVLAAAVPVLLGLARRPPAAPTGPAAPPYR